MLTESEKKTYMFISDYIKQQGIAPTLPEIAAGIGISSKGVIHRYVQALAEKGWITLIPKVHRGIKLTSKALSKAFSLPLLGTIAAGQPIEAIQTHTEIDLASIFAGEGRYLLRVRGDSMIDEGIYDGDMIICQQTTQVHNNDIVIALIDKQEATLKRLQRNIDGTITLIPANPSYSPMTYPAHRVSVQGIFIGLLRVPR